MYLLQPHCGSSNGVSDGPLVGRTAVALGSNSGRGPTLCSPPSVPSSHTQTASCLQATKTLGQSYPRPSVPRWMMRAGTLCSEDRTCLVPYRGLGESIVYCVSKNFAPAVSSTTAAGAGITPFALPLLVRSQTRSNTMGTSFLDLSVPFFHYSPKAVHPNCHEIYYMLQ